jgi:light-regulated signal transduction histidine kinase (bacteriophytochrome)
MVHDITERKRAEEDRDRLLVEVQRRAADLDVANKELEAFSYSVSHDLRAPLRHIDGFSSILEQAYADKLDERGRQYLMYLREGSQKMEQLIDAMLQLSRASRVEMSRQPVNLSDLAQSIVADLQRTEPERPVELDIAPGVVANGDPHLLSSVLENLLSNSWKFTAKGPVTKIEFGVTQKDGRKAYYVRDNGVGFDMAYADKLFVAFQRLHKAADFSGTGIGLATVQRIIHRHGGEVWAEAAVDNGATFYFTLE